MILVGLLIEVIYITTGFINRITEVVKVVAYVSERARKTFTLLVKKVKFANKLI